MPKVIELSPHIANLIAAGEVVERPASVAKELLENAVDAGASKVIIEIRDGGMTFLRVTDNGSGMERGDAVTAFKRHATSKLRSAEDLAAIETMGFRGEALAAIASVSRVELMTKTPGSIAGTSLRLEGGELLENSEIGCPDGTTILVRDLFFNTPARMKFMKSDSYEGARVASAVQLQALAHPEVSFTFLRDGKQQLVTPGDGELQSAVYCVYGRESGAMVRVQSRWEEYSLTGFVSKPTDARPSRNLQTFFVNGRPVKSRLLVSALEEAYRNQLMVGKFPACVLHLHLSAAAVDVNVHPAKTEVKFLSEKNVFDCVHYGVLAALNQTTDRPPVRFPQRPAAPEAPVPDPREPARARTAAPQRDFFRTMTPQEYRELSTALQNAPKVEPQAAASVAASVAAAVERQRPQLVREPVRMPVASPPMPEPASTPEPAPAPEPEQVQLPMPQEKPWKLVGELYRSYILVEQGDEAFLIDKHAAHERILFDKLKANPEKITSQMLLTPLPVQLAPEEAAALLAEPEKMQALGFEIGEFGDNTVLVRQIPMDLPLPDAADTLQELAAHLLAGRADSPDSVRDEMLHTVACKAAIKAGWVTDPAELRALVDKVMSTSELKYCPHGRPICITLSKKLLEKQFKRT
ncbi:MAG: DNA mismatch repair endonuclease MutL [Firmicutes bacterium]|nr:DNA mismatch repair endonuclease MutL [Bacillota bacterium]